MSQPKSSSKRCNFSTPTDTTIDKAICVVVEKEDDKTTGTQVRCDMDLMPDNVFDCGRVVGDVLIQVSRYVLEQLDSEEERSIASTALAEGFSSHLQYNTEIAEALEEVTPRYVLSQVDSDESKN
jgi:hypothetical protein